MNHLQDSQKEALANYQAITETWDSDRALELLQKHNWDVTQASNEFFSASQLTNTSVSIPSNAPNLSWNKKFSTFFSNMWKTIVPESIRGDVSTEAEEFSSRLKTVCHPSLNFSTLLFSELLQLAYESEKIVFVFVHRFSFEYPQELFSDARIVQLLNKEFIYWGVESDNKVGQMLRDRLNIQNFPCFVLLRVDVPNRPAVLKMHQGYLDKKDVIKILEDHSVSIDPQVLIERRLREAQEEEFLEAEKLAQEKEKFEKMQKLRIEEKKMEKIEKIQNLIKKIGPEPDLGENSILVSFRLGSGRRFDRRFSKEDKVRVLFEYLETQDIEAEEILTGFPLKNLNNKEISLDDAQILHQSVIHVRERT